MNPALSLFDYYTLTNKKNVLISYKGPVTDVIMAEISRDIRNKLADDPKASRRVFSIFMELAQNILFYSAEKVSFADYNDSVGIILITKIEDKIHFSCGNLVENDYVEELVDAINKINNLDRDDLRKYKREMRDKEKRSDRSKGAGIGLIQVAITARHPLEVEYRKLGDDLSFFSLSVVIDSLTENVKEDF